MTSARTAAIHIVINMKELVVRGRGLAETYHKALVELSKFGETVDSDDWKCSCIESAMTMVINEPLSEPMISRCCICSPESLEQYKLELIYGILDFKIGHGWDYTYHDRIANYYVDNCDKFPETHSLNQVDFVINELLKNPNSRRAVIDVRDNSDDAYSSDPACLQHIQYFIREDKLDCCVLFRSNDATRANFMNCFGLIMLQKFIADAIGRKVGTFTLRANSFHCYSHEFQNLVNYVKKIEEKGYADRSITFNYEGDWSRKMMLKDTEIMTKVSKLQEEKA